MVLQNLCPLIVAPNMEQKNSVRIFTCYFGYQKELRKHFEVPLLRVGSMAIYRIGLEDLKERSAHLLMLRHMLISLLTFPLFLKLTSTLTIPIARPLAYVLTTLVSLRYCLSSIEDISQDLCEKINQAPLNMLSNLCPHTLYIDTFLNSRDMLALLLLRYTQLQKDLFALITANSQKQMVSPLSQPVVV